MNKQRRTPSVGGVIVSIEWASLLWVAVAAITSWAFLVMAYGSAHPGVGGPLQAADHITWTAITACTVGVLLLGVIHELGHCLARQATGATLVKVSATWKGLAVHHRVDRPTGWKEASCAAAGPMAHLVAAVATLWATAAIFDALTPLGVAGLISVLLAIGALLPLPSCDGLRVVRAFRTNQPRAQQTAAVRTTAPTYQADERASRRQS